MAKLKTVIPVRKKASGAVETFTTSKNQLDNYTKIDITTDDCGYVIFEMDSTTDGMFMVSQVSAGRKCFFNFEINFEKATIWWNQENPEHAWIGHRGMSNEILIKDQAIMSPMAGAYVHAPAGHPEGYLDSLKNLFICFYDSIVNKDNYNSSNTPAFPTFSDAHDIMKVCEAIAKSHRECRWIDVINE